MKTCIALMMLGLALAACGGSAPPAAESTAPDETAALDSLRKTNQAQATYFKINRRYALTFEELVEAHLLNSDPSAAKTGYDFRLRPAADAQSYRLSVSPSNSNAAAARHFSADQSGVIRAESGKEASADSPEVN